MAASTRWTGLALLLMLAPAARAQDTPPQAQLDLEAKLISSLADAINTGAPLFNPPNNDAAGCYRIYQGAIKAVMPLLNHRPDLVKSVQEAMQKAESQTTPSDKAFELRKALDEIRTTLYKDQPKPAAGAAGTPSTTKPLWDRLGGETAVQAVVHDFVAKAVLDVRVNFMRTRPALEAAATATLEGRIVDFISHNTGGPRRYEGKDMVEAHRNMSITEQEFDSMVDDLKEVLKSRNVPQRESDELVAIVMSTKKDIVGK